MFSFMFLFVLNSINNPIPAPVNNPESVAPRVIVLFIYNSVISILAPQFGISPTKLDKKYENIVFFMNKLLNFGRFNGFFHFFHLLFRKFSMADRTYFQCITDYFFASWTLFHFFPPQIKQNRKVCLYFLLYYIRRNTKYHLLRIGSFIFSR